MKEDRDFQAAPAFRVGERLFLVIIRRSLTRWDGGILGECSPVAMVAVENDSCAAWHLQDQITPEELREALISFTEIPR